MRHLIATTCLFAGAAFAQLPGQQPFPTGQQRSGPRTFPPPTVPLPRTTTPPARGPQPQPRGTTSSTGLLVSRTTEGILRRLSPDEFIIESFDHRVIWFGIGDVVALTPEKYHVGDHVTVTSTEDSQGNYTAVSVQWDAAGTEEDRRRAEETWDLPEGSVVPEKAERPKLTRGGKAPEPEAPPAPKSERVRTGPLPNHPDDAAIARAREAAASYLDELPSFAAKQNTTRYIQENSRARWSALDIVTTDLVFKNGAEEYSNVKVNNKSVDKSMDEIDGLRSTGEFGSIIANLFDPESGTDFQRPSQVELRGRRAWKYRFLVPRERSDFRIHTPSQLYYASQEGSVWIDFETDRVLRLEIQARELPKEFPFDTIEMNIDLDYVRLDGAKQFLLPTDSEALNCIRGTSVCMKNSTSFRNYVKFNAESSVIFEK